MTNPKRRMKPAVVAGALGLAAASVFASAAKAADVSAAVDSVMKDANQHSQLLAAGDGLTLKSGEFSLTPGAGVVFTHVLSWGDERKHGDSAMDTGFEVTRADVWLTGNVHDVKYCLSWDAGDINGGVGLRDAHMAYVVNDQVQIIAGQMIDPVHHEALVSSFKQLGTTRSLVNELIGSPEGISGYVQGAGMTYTQDSVKLTVLFHDGASSGNTSWMDAGTSWGLSGRVEVLVQGARAAYDDFSARNNKADLLVIGGGADLTQGDNFNAIALTVDCQYETAGGLSVYGAFLGTYVDPRNTGSDDSTFDWGFLVQAGYAISNTMELFGRVDMTKFENVQVADEDTFWEIGGGLNYFLGKDGAAGHNAKVTLEANYLPNGSPSGASYQHIIGGSDQAELIVAATLTLML